MSQTSIEEVQKALCEKFEAEYLPSPRGLKIGIASNVIDGLLPINGVRHPPEGDTTGWYVWAGGEPSDDPDFFKPLHVEHINDVCPAISGYLGLAPGWRFLIDTNGYEDVWFDKNLLDI